MAAPAPDQGATCRQIGTSLRRLSCVVVMQTAKHRKRQDLLSEVVLDFSSIRRIVVQAFVRTNSMIEGQEFRYVPMQFIPWTTMRCSCFARFLLVTPRCGAEANQVHRQIILNQPHRN
jgi:hypothetical protein